MCFSISCVFSYNCIKLIVFWVDILVYFHRIFVFFFFFLGYRLCKDWFNLSWKSLIQQSIFNEGSGPTSRKFRIAAWCMQLEVASRTNVNGCLKVAVVAVMFILFFSRRIPFAVSAASFCLLYYCRHAGWTLCLVFYAFKLPFKNCQHF